MTLLSCWFDLQDLGPSVFVELFSDSVALIVSYIMIPLNWTWPIGLQNRLYQVQCWVQKNAILKMHGILTELLNLFSTSSFIQYFKSLIKFSIFPCLEQVEVSQFVWYHPSIAVPAILPQVLSIYCVLSCPRYGLSFLDLQEYFQQRWKFKQFHNGLWLKK